MRSLMFLRVKHFRWRLFPFPAIKCGVISLAVVVGALFCLDQLVLPFLEKRGLTSGENWARHNAVVIAEHQLADRTVDFPGPKSSVTVGVRSWVGQPVTEQKAPGIRRVLVLGDSFVWGSPYLSLNHMWWRQLAGILEEDSIEVIALGRPGASTKDQLEWARYFVPLYQPDLMIWGYVNNDADEGLVRQISMTQQSIPRLDRVRSLARQVWPRVTAKFDALRNNKLAKMYTGPEYGYEYSEWELKLVESDNLNAYSRTVAKVKSFLQESGIPSFMMTLPNYPSAEYFEPRIAPIIKVWREAGIPAYDTVPEFVRRYGETPPAGPEAIQWGINPADGHPGPRSCRFLAEQAAHIIRRDFPQILGEKVPGPIDPIINDWLPNLVEGAYPKWDERRKVWEMSYPSDESRWPTMPLEEPTVLLAFQHPVSITSLKLNGPALKSARVWITCIDPNEHYDDGIAHDLGERQGQRLEWKMPDELAKRTVSTLRFRATFSAADHELNWSFQR